MSGDWRGSSSWGPIQAIIGAIGVILAEFTNATLPLKVGILLLGVIACGYTVLSKRGPRPSATAQSSGIPFVEQKEHTSHAAQYIPRDPVSYVPPVMLRGRPIDQSPKAHIERILIGLILFGLPGFVLVRSGVVWLEVPGYIFLILLFLTFLSPLRGPMYRASAYLHYLAEQLRAKRY
jgi:hypothetical protein